MTYSKIVYSLTGLDDDEQGLVVDSMETRDIERDWFEFCYDHGIIRRVVTEEDDEEEEEE